MPAVPGRKIDAPKASGPVRMKMDLPPLERPVGLRSPIAIAIEAMTPSQTDCLFFVPKAGQSLDALRASLQNTACRMQMKAADERSYRTRKIVRDGVNGIGVWRVK